MRAYWQGVKTSFQTDARTFLRSANTFFQSAKRKSAKKAREESKLPWRGRFSLFLLFVGYFHRIPRPMASDFARAEELHRVNQKLLEYRGKRKKAEREHRDAIRNYELSVRGEARLPQPFRLIDRERREKEIEELHASIERYTNRLGEMCRVAQYFGFAVKEDSFL
jgi:hypothetical protein